MFYEQGYGEEEVKQIRFIVLFMRNINELFAETVVHETQHLQWNCIASVAGRVCPGT